MSLEISQEIVGLYTTGAAGVTGYAFVDDKVLLKRLQRNLITDALEGGKEFDVRSEDKIAESKTKAGYLDNQAKYQPGPIASELMQYSDLKETEDQIITDSIRERAKALKKSKPVPGSEEAVQFNNDVNDLGKKITISRIAGLHNCSTRTIHRYMGKELKTEKQRLNDELWFSQFDPNVVKDFKKYEKL